MSQARSSYAIGTGLFIVLGFAALAYLATQTSSLANVHQGDSYTVKAEFTNIGQLKERAPVKIAGVRVGQVQSIALASDHDVADVTEMTELACATARREGFGEAGETVVISAGLPFGVSGTTNLLRIAHIH